MKVIQGTLNSVEVVKPLTKWLEPIAVLSIVDQTGSLRVGYAPATSLCCTIAFLFGDHPEGRDVTVKLEDHTVVGIEARGYAPRGALA